MKRFFKLTLIMGIMTIAFAITNISYADEDFDILTPSDLITQTTTTTTTQTTLDLTTKTTSTTSAKTTKTT